jgi:predicted acetyltransferase
MPKRQKYLKKKKKNIFLIKNDSNRENIILGTKKITSGLHVQKMNVTFGEHPLSVSPFLL